MALPFRFNTTNGYTVEYNSCISNEMKAKGVKSVLSISMLGSDTKEFIFVNTDRLNKLYRCLLTMYQMIHEDKKSLRTIDFPSIKLDEYMGVVITEKSNCLITLKSKHITKKDDSYKTTDMIEIDHDNLQTLLMVMGKSLYDEEE